MTSQKYRHARAILLTCGLLSPSLASAAGYGQPPARQPYEYSDAGPQFNEQPVGRAPRRALSRSVGASGVPRQDRSMRQAAAAPPARTPSHYDEYAPDAQQDDYQPADAAPVNAAWQAGDTGPEYETLELTEPPNEEINRPGTSGRQRSSAPASQSRAARDQSPGPGPDFFEATRYWGPFNSGYAGGYDSGYTNDSYSDYANEAYGNAAYGGEVYEGGGYGGEPYDPYGYDANGVDGCGDYCAQPCQGPFYLRGEYLMWWLKGDHSPPLVTTSPSSTPQSQAGALGAPGTTILFGGQSVNNTGRSGGRVVVGWWLDGCSRIEGEWFGLATKGTSFDQSSPGSPILARPFYSITRGIPAANLLAYPGVFSGGISINESSSFYGAGVHAIRDVCCERMPSGFLRRVGVLYGFRYLGLYENLTVNSSTRVLSGPLPPQVALSVHDGFKTSSTFLGANLGAMVDHTRGCWTFTTIGRIGLGGTVERVNISGNTVATAPSGATINTAGGLLALPSNMGSVSHSGFTAVPQLELKLAYDFNPNWRFTVGYDILYWSRVVRPGQQVDLHLNTTQAGGGALMGTPGPLLPFRETDLWLQGVSAGAEFRF